MNDQDLTAISSMLNTAGARLARRTEPDADLALLDAYAALLAARMELAPLLMVMPAPILDEDGAPEPAAIADDLATAWTALRDYALDAPEDAALACARAATYVDDARRHLLASAA
jgi:hypothetical protein